MQPLFRPWSRRTPKAAESRARRPRRQQLGLEALEGRQLMTLATEFLVNTNSTVDSDEFHTDNASGANGDFVVVWTGTTSRDDFDVFAKVYNSSGQALTGEINVDATTLQAGDPTVAMDAQGNFIVAWVREEFNGDDNIVMRKYNRFGTELTTAPFHITQSAASEQSPSIAMANNGSFVVSYEQFQTLPSGKNDVDVVAQLRRSDLTLQKTISVAPSDSTLDQDPSVAMTPSGQFAVAYETRVPAGRVDIRLAQFNSTGTLQRDLAITSSSAVSEVQPDLDLDNAGNAVVVYEEIFTPAGSGNTNFDIKARRVTSGGALGSLINVTTTLADDEEDATVALHPTNGSFVVAYDLTPFSGGGSRLRVKEYSAANNVLATFSDFFIGDKGGALSIDNDGDYILTYSGKNVGTTDIFGRRGRRS